MSASFDEAVALHRQGSLDEAASSYERVLEAEPSNFRAAYNLSLLRAQQGRMDEALRLGASAATLDAGSAEALAHLGGLLLGVGRHREAIDFLERAVAIDPTYAQAHNNLGSALLPLGKIEEAAACYRRAIEIQPRYADAHANLGHALRLLGRLDEAMAHFEMAPAARPDNARAFGDMGNALAEMGRLDEALVAYERAIALEPRPELFRYIGDLRKYTPGDRYLAAMEQLFERVDSFEVDGQIDLHFALGKAYADVGEHQRSFRHLLAGNALKRGIQPYDEAATLASFEEIPRVFTAEMMAAHEGQGDPSRVPIFVLGMPRSGTTLVEQILAGHPAVHAAGELEIFGETVAALFPDGGVALTPERLRELGARYVERVRALAPEAERVTDKMPANFRFAGLIHLALPNARIISTRRDPIDNCLSCFSLLFQEGQPHLYDLAELGRYYRGYEALVAHWHKVLPAGVMLDVQYEDVVADLETQARRIVAHAGLPWNDACLKFHEVRRPVQTASASQVRKPIFTSSVGRWRPYGELLRPLLDALG
jgi:tetratricopeptide (TPR) repeat protein